MRKFLNIHLKLKKIANSSIFDALMMFILTINCGIIIAAGIETNEEKIKKLDLADTVILYFYTMECTIKALGLGLEKYYDDDWNKFDLALVIMSWGSDFFMSYMASFKAAKSAKMTKLLKITKLNRVFKMFRACRSIKMLNVFCVGMDLFGAV